MPVLSALPKKATQKRSLGFCIAACRRAFGSVSLRITTSKLIPSVGERENAVVELLYTAMRCFHCAPVLKLLSMRIQAWRWGIRFGSG